jgi:hypothetical protein
VAHQMRSWARRQAIKVPLVHRVGAKLTKRFKVERELIRGAHHNENAHRSILHFSVNKAATQYTKSILSRCATENGLTHVRLHDYAFFSDFPYLDRLTAQQMIEYQYIFKPLGYLYSVFGGMIEGIPNLDRYHVVLMVRDPRDVLTSGYFSIAYSHVPPTGRDKIESFNKERAFARQAGIDQYVASKSEHVCHVYRRYVDLLMHKWPNVYVTRYEDMIADFAGWLDCLLRYCELRVSPRLKQELLEEASRAHPKKEDTSRNMRQVIPGDHRRKLQSGTIERLNCLFSGVLADFKYT